MDNPSPQTDTPALPWTLRLSLVLLGLLACLPFIQPIHHPPIPSFYEEWLAVLIGLLAFLAAVSAKDLTIVVPRIAWLPGLIALATGLQFALGLIEIPLLGFFYLGYSLWALMMCVLGASLAQHIGRAHLIQALALGLLAGALLSAVLAFVQRLEIRLPLYLLMPAYDGRIYANIAQPNQLTTYLWMGLCTLLYLRQQERLSSAYTLAGLLILASACGLTGSRMAYLHGLGLILLTLWLARRSPEQAAHHKVRTQVLWLVAALLSLYSAAELSRLLPWHYTKAPLSGLERLQAGLVHGDARLDIWRDTITLIKNHPWLGNGVGNYSWNMVAAAAQAPAGASSLPNSEHAHNMTLQLAADFGLPLTLLCCALVLCWSIPQLRRRTTDATTALALSLLLLLAIHSQLEYPLWDSTFLGLSALLLGALSQHPGQAAGLRRPVLQAVTGVAILALLPIHDDYVTLDDTLIVRNRMDQADWRRRIGALEHLALNSSLAPYAHASLGLLMAPEHRLAGAQSQICETAMKMVADHTLITKCAILHQLNGQETTARQRLSLAKQAYRRADEQADIDNILQQEAQRYPEISRLATNPQL